MVQEHQPERKTRHHHRECTGIVRVGRHNKALMLVVPVRPNGNLLGALQEAVARPVVHDFELENAVHVWNLQPAGKKLDRTSCLHAGQRMMMRHFRKSPVTTGEFGDGKISFSQVPHAQGTHVDLGTPQHKQSSRARTGYAATEKKIVM